MLPKDFETRLSQSHLTPLWTSLKKLVPRQPTPSADPWMWRFADVQPSLLRAGELVTAEEAERRVLVLTNPGLEGKLQITDTLYAGLQLILPGEIAPPHRHSQSALRFVLDGVGARTRVNGRSTLMQPGDFIITPAMVWHEHEGGSEPVIWLDGLDVPLVAFLQAGFREELSINSSPDLQLFSQGTTMPHGAILPLRMDGGDVEPIAFSYPYAYAREELFKARMREIDAHHGSTLRYNHPRTQDWAIPTIATSLRMLPAGFQGLAYRSTDSAVYVVTEGHLTIEIGALTFDVGPRDVVAVPGWCWHSVRAASETVLFVFSDRAAQEKLGLWREQRSLNSSV